MDLGRRLRSARKWVEQRLRPKVFLALGLITILAAVLLRFASGVGDYGRNLALNLGADLIGAIVVIFVISPLITRAQHGRVREHRRLDYDWFTDQVVNATSEVRILDTFSGLLDRPGTLRFLRAVSDAIDRNAHVKILLIDPDSLAAAQRASELGQVALNEPVLDGRSLPGLQHKYPETLLVFPRPGQSCHAYCQYCFRWPQFVGEPGLKIATGDPVPTTAYLAAHPEITDVLLTGGDPLVMSTAVLSRYLEPLLAVGTVSSIRISTKALSYWPYRFVTDPDAPDLLRLMERVTASGRHLAVMAHVSHPRELEPPVVGTALQRIQQTGAIIRAQAPLIRTINDDAAVWAQLWRRLTASGVIPYYMFVERDTGPQHYFAVPLERGYEIFRDAYASVSGLARTVRGPVMSATAGKVCIDGIATLAGERVFVLRYLRAREPDLVGRPFFAQVDPAATWLTDLKPALGATELAPT